MKVVTIIPLKKGAWKENLTYFTTKDVQNGNIVVVSLRNKKVLGLVVSSAPATSLKSNIKNMSFNLKKIIEIKEHSIFSRKYLDGAIETSRYFAMGKNNGITSLLPASFRENYDKLAPTVVGVPIEVGTKKSELKSEKLIFQAGTEDRISSYKTLIRGSFAQKKSVFMVLPTAHDIKIFEEVLSRGIEQFTFSFHGGLNTKKIIDKFKSVLSTPHPVLILGTAPFLSIPRRDLGTIVIEHESSSAYKMIGKSHLDLRFFAELFATKINAKLILADTLLRYETLARIETGGISALHPLQFRINFEGQIKIKTSNQAPVFRIFSDETLEEIKNTLAKKKNVFIFTLRKGLATMTLCRDCNETVSCDKCGAPLVLHLSHQGKKRIFVCNRCERDVDGDTVCATCGSWNLMPLGIGTDTVYEYLKKTLGNENKAKILKLDKEVAKNTKGAEAIIKDFEENPGSILIGTEMSFFYLEKKVPMSVIASFDSLWSIPNFKMSEKIIQIVLSVIEHTNEKIIIQTKNENDPALLAIQSENLLHFVREELEDRKKLDYPPFKRFIKITYLGNKEETMKSRKMLEEIFEGYHPEIFSGFVAQLKGKYVTNTLLKIDPKKWSLPEMSLGASIDENLLSKLLSLPPSFEIFVDPEDLL